MRSGRGSAGRCAGGEHREREGARQALAISSPEGSALTGGKLFTAANAAAAAALPPFIHRNVTVSLHPRPGDRWGMEIFPFYFNDLLKCPIYRQNLREDLDHWAAIRIAAAFPQRYPQGPCILYRFDLMVT